jgi:restriction system protein
MAKRTGLVSTLAQIQRGAARADTAGARRAEQERRADERAEAADERERKRIHAVSRATQVDELNSNLEQCVASLQQLLEATLRVDHSLDFDSLKQTPAVRTFEPGDLAVAEPLPDPSTFSVPPLTGPKRRLPGGRERQAAAVAEADSQLQAALAAHAAREEERKRRLRGAVEAHERRNAKLIAEAEEQHQAVESFRAAFEARDRRAVVRYFTLVLARSSHGADFPSAARIAYVPDSKELVVESELPPVSVVPTAKAFKYVRASDTITITPRPAAQLKALYASALAQIALRTIYQLFDGDRLDQVQAVVFNGYVDTVDAATGNAVRACLVSLRAPRTTFRELDLAHVDAVACLRHLGARVSKSPAEHSPVRPLLRLAPKEAPAEEIVLEHTQEQVVDLERGTVTVGLRSWVTLEARQWDTDSLDGDQLAGAGYALRALDGQPVPFDDPRLEAFGCRVARVAGVSYPMDAVQLPMFDPGQQLLLVRDRNNSHDANGVALFDLAQDHQVGFLPRDVAVNVAPRLDAGEQFGVLSLWEWRDEHHDRVALRVLVGPPEDIESMVVQLKEDSQV